MVTDQKKNPCRSCAALLVSSENDSPPLKPHEYLLAVGTKAGGPARYACLICNTSLESAGAPAAKWKLAE